MYVIYPTVVKVVVDKTSSKVVNRRGINKTGGERNNNSKGKVVGRRGEEEEEEEYKTGMSVKKYPHS